MSPRAALPGRRGAGSAGAGGKRGRGQGPARPGERRLGAAWSGLAFPACSAAPVPAGPPCCRSERQGERQAASGLGGAEIRLHPTAPPVSIGTGPGPRRAAHLSGAAGGAILVGRPGGAAPGRPEGERRRGAAPGSL